MNAVRRSAVLAVIIAAMFTTTASALAEASGSAKETCRVAEATDTIKSFAFRTVLLKTKMSVSWCHNGNKITRASVTCLIEQIDRVTISIDRCQPQGSFISWQGDPRGGFYAQTSVNFSNCVFKYGCWQSGVQRIIRWFYADGTITKAPRDGVDNV